MLIPAERLIVVNASEAMSGDIPTRRHRFTIAHELGHWICHARDNGDAPPHYCRSQDVSRDTNRILEREANVFAAELLMPEAAVRAEWERIDPELRVSSRREQVLETWRPPSMCRPAPCGFAFTASRSCRPSPTRLRTCRRPTSRRFFWGFLRLWRYLATAILSRRASVPICAAGSNLFTREQAAASGDGLPSCRCGGERSSASAGELLRRGWWPLTQMGQELGRSVRYSCGASRERVDPPPTGLQRHGGER